MGKIDVKYATTVTVSGGREGHAVSNDGVLDVQLRRPKTNGVSEGTNPEQLFAAAWGACLQSAFNHQARQAGIDAAGSTVKVEIGQGPDADGGYGLAAKIEIAAPGIERAQLESLAAAAHAGCPYSRAVRGNVDVELTVV